MTVDLTLDGKTYNLDIVSAKHILNHVYEYPSTLHIGGEEIDLNDSNLYEIKKQLHTQIYA